jgi:hypothetical protein
MVARLTAGATTVIPVAARCPTAFQASGPRVVLRRGATHSRSCAISGRRSEPAFLAAEEEADVAAPARAWGSR